MMLRAAGDDIFIVTQVTWARGMTVGWREWDHSWRYLRVSKHLKAAGVGERNKDGRQVYSLGAG